MKDNASVFARFIRIASNNSKGTLNLNLLGGTLTTSNSTAILRGAAGSKVNVVLDGVTWYSDLAETATMLQNTLNDVKVGTRGVVFGGNRNIDWKWQHIKHTISYTNSAPGESRAPISFQAVRSNRHTQYRVANDCSWDGPVLMGKYTRLDLMTNASYAASHELAMEGGTWLRITGGPRTFGTLSLTRSASDSSGIDLHVHADSTITVTDEFRHPGTGTVALQLYAADGGMYATPLATPGVYTVIDAPAASFAALKSTSFLHGNPVAGTVSFVRVVEESGRARLQVVISTDPANVYGTSAWSNGTGDGLWKTDGNWGGGAAVNSASVVADFSKDAAAGGETVTLAGQAAAGGIAFSGANGYTVTGGELLLGDASGAGISSVAPMTNTIAAKITATGQLNVNPVRSGGGTVKLTGDLSGLVGGLAVNSGTLEVNDLSFVTDASKLVLGQGTFAYTGTEPAELAGMAFASAAPTCGVLRVDTPLTLRSAASYGGLLVKTGAETLKFKGNGTFDLFGGSATTTWGVDANYIGESGDGPSSGTYGVTVREGRLEIGTAGDASDAPVVTTRSLAVGGQPLDGRAAAEIVVNNGTVTVDRGLKVDGYAGGSATNKLTVNGGTLSVGVAIAPGLAVRGANDALAPAVVTINGGLLESRTDKVKLFENNNEMELFLNEGGTLKTLGFDGGSDGDLRGVAHFDGGTFTPVCNPPTAEYLNNVAYLRYLRHAYIGARGLVVDTRHFRDLGNLNTCYLNLQQRFEKDPALGDARDGGIRVTGDGMLYFGSRYASDGFEGDITVEDGASLMAYRTTGVGPTVKIKAGATLRTYQSGAYPLYVDFLVLGEVGASKPARFEVRTSDGRNINNCIVSNDFTVAGPVCFASRWNWQDQVLANATTGVYTMFVYRASCDANVDVAKFSIDPEMSPLAADFEKVDVTLAGEGGWKAIVATVRMATAGELPRWTATSTGGSWSDSANWNGAAAPGKPNEVAQFAPAEAANVPVTMDVSATVGQALFEATAAGNGYALGGNGTLTFASSGDSVLDVATGGKVTVNAAVASDGLLCVNAAQSSATRGTAGEVVFGAGALDGFAGTLYPRSGTVTIPSLAWMTDYTQLRLGFGTVKYTGTGETIPGFQTAPTLTYMATLEIENDLTVDGRTSTVENGAFMKAGPGTLTFKGTGSYSLGNNHNYAYDKNDETLNRRCPNGDSPTNATVNLSVAAGRLVVGERDATSGPRVSTSAYAAIGVPAGGDADPEMVIESGSFSIEKHQLYIGYYNGIGSTGTHPKLTVNGGTVTLPKCIYMDEDSGQDTRQTVCSPTMEVNGGTVTVANSIYMGDAFAISAAAKAADTTCTLEVNGGLVTVMTNVYLVFREGTANRASKGLVKLNGGVLDVKGTVLLSRNSKTTGTLWLNDGGVLKAGTVNTKREGGTFYFNGGTFLPYGVLPNGSSSATLSDVGTTSGTMDFLVSTNGAIISTANAKDGLYTISAALKHDPALAGADGGLVKTGAGTLALSGANTYTGPTVVDAGTLTVLNDAALSDSTVVRKNALLDLGGARTLGNLTGDGTVCGDLTLAGALTPQNGIPTGGEMVPYGSRYLVLRVTGTVDTNAKFKAINCGQPCTLATTVEDGLVYVTTKSGGTLLLFR